MSKPCILLVPEFTEVQWTIKPLLEQWAEVRSYDPPGVGSEPSDRGLSREAVLERGLKELDQSGWERFFVVADGWAIASAARIAERHPEGVAGIALGHASLSYHREGERAPINREVFSAMDQLIRSDARSFIRYGIAQATGGSIDEDVAERMVARMPVERLAEGWEALTADEDFGDLLGRIECPMLLAKHEGCLMSTDEGFDDAAELLPHAPKIAVPDAPCASPDFAEALRRFSASAW
jgi:pimeloyl-ACP methyl ester carboxylesterase